MLGDRIINRLCYRQQRETLHDQIVEELKQGVDLHEVLDRLTVKELAGLCVYHNLVRARGREAILDRLFHFYRCEYLPGRQSSCSTQ